MDQTPVINVAIPAALHGKLKDYSDQAGMKLRAVVERAVDEYIAKQRPVKPRKKLR